MTIEEVISKVDELAPNQYSTEQKIGWLSSLDGQIEEEIIRTHEGADPYRYMPARGYQTDSEQLLIQGSYAEDVYVNYLLSKITSMNGEIVKYQQYASLFNARYTEYTNWYNRTHMPIKRGRIKF